MTSFSAIHHILFSSLVALVLCLCPVSASARLSAEASLNYSNYSVKDDRNNHLSAYSLSQDYSLLYSKSGLLYNSRLGRYDVSLGYNWSVLDSHTSSNVGNSDLSTNRGHIFYSGEILLDPKEIPIRLNAYSRDLTRNTFTTTDSAPVNAFFTKNDGRLLGNADLATGINDGVHIESGVTLIAGVKNGMTNGYNEILRHFPMIMIDYKDQINRDLRSESPVDNRLSRLAFVSLNKKDNWFHYRYTTYKDNIDSTNDYSERQFQLGTIDQNLSRRWIDFSNWLQVSADLQLTKRVNNNLALNYEESDLNLFFQARRSKWEARSYNNFNRYREENGKLTYHTSVPLHVYGVLNPEVSWSTRTSYRESHDNAGARLENLLAGYRVEGFKRSLFTLTHNLDVESSVSELSDMLVLSAGIETTSSKRFSQLFSHAASYSIKNTSQKGSLNNTDFLEQRLSLRSSYTPTNQLRFNFMQTNEFTSGKQSNFLTSVRDSNTSLPQYVSPRSGSADDMGSSSYHSVTSFSVAWNPLARLNIGLVINEDIFSSEKYKTSNITNVSAMLEYDNAVFRFNNTLTYSDGSSQINSNISYLNNVTTVQYKYSRNLDSRLMMIFNRNMENSVSSNSYDLEQRLDYTHYSYTGFSRKLFEINEMITYSSSPGLVSNWYTVNNINSANTISSSNNTAVAGSNGSRSSFSLGFKYYPLRQLVLSAGGRYQFDNNVNNYSLLWYSSVATNFRLFQASLDYYQGKRQSDGLLEKKFTANVKKVF